MSCRMRACEVATYVEHMPFIVPCRVRAREQVTSEIGRDLT